MHVASYQPEDWPQVRSFLDTHWRTGHPLTDEALFHWQFAGFSAAENGACQIAWHDDEVVGFLGGIPAPYCADGRTIRGVAFDVWIVRLDLRHEALGLRLVRRLETQFDACCALGVNRKVLDYYHAAGYAHCPALRRFIACLDPSTMARLLAAASGAQRVAQDLTDAGRAATDDNARPQPLPAPEELADLYARTAGRVFRFGLDRTPAFWRWRYADAVGFDYVCFGDSAGPGVIIARVETIQAAAHPDLDDLRVLRLIELLPDSEAAWQGAINREFMDLLKAVLSWARSQGCILADFQHSSARLQPTLAAAGLVAQQSGGGRAVDRVPQLFQPLRADVLPINAVWRLGPSVNITTPTDANDVYFVKSDAGMDRPYESVLHPHAAH
jgi:hypothetical protein